tara:strand:+ start:70 stop:720 length:651 start_codon:yes stop_codon:yes gene_type:complete
VSVKELSVPIGIRPKIKIKSGVADLNNFIIESFSVMAFIRKQKFLDKVLMTKLEKIIKEFKSADVEKKQAQQKLDTYHMTDYRSHLIYDEFKQLSDYVLTICEDNASSYNYRTVDCWGALYRKGDYIKTHSHWPCSLSWIYYIKVTENTSPLIFVNKIVPELDKNSNGEHIIQPESGDLIIFPSILNHRVPAEKSDDERIMAAGNITMGMEDNNER